MNKKRTLIKTPFNHSDAGIELNVDDESDEEFINYFALGIGWIVIEFNSLESLIDYLIKEKLSNSYARDEVVYLSLSKMQISEKVDLLMRLYGLSIYNNYEFKLHRKPLELLHSKLKKACENRNKYVHTNWYEKYNEGFYKVRTQAKRDGVHHTFAKYEKEHLQEDLELIQDLHDELFDFDENIDYVVRSSSTKLLVFSYGSNMFNARLKERVPSTQFIGIGKLKGFLLNFSKISKDGSGKATVISSTDKSKNVWGTLSLIDKSEKPLLDKVEGLNKGYDEMVQLITTESDETVAATLYVGSENSLDPILNPYDWYLKYVTEGAKMNNLPDEYIESLTNFESIKDLNIKRMNKHLKIIGGNN